MLRVPVARADVLLAGRAVDVTSWASVASVCGADVVLAAIRRLVVARVSRRTLVWSTCSPVLTLAGVKIAAADVPEGDSPLDSPLAGSSLAAKTLRTGESDRVSSAKHTQTSKAAASVISAWFVANWRRRRAISSREVILVLICGCSAWLARIRCT